MTITILTILSIILGFLSVFLPTQVLYVLIFWFVYNLIIDLRHVCSGGSLVLFGSPWPAAAVIGSWSATVICLGEVLSRFGIDIFPAI